MSRTVILTVLACVVGAATACRADATQGASPSPAAAAGGPQTEEQKTLYALGMILGRNVKDFSLSPQEMAMVEKGFRDAATGAKPAVELETYGPKVRDLAQSKAAQRSTTEQAKGTDYIAKAATQQGAVKTPSGMVYRETQAGTGPSPAATDTVRVHYRGTLLDGTEFDSSHKRGEPAEFRLNQVIPCWTEGVQKMKVGGKAQLVCPSGLAYGDRGTPGIPPGSTLIFDVELLEVKKGAGPPVQ